MFLKARDPKALGDWYRVHIGLDVQAWGGTKFEWDKSTTKERPGVTVWSLFPEDSKYFAPSTERFMVNYRVENLARLLSELREEGCSVDERMEESEYGKFGWVMDPEGNRIELWEPPLGTFPG